jgi:hypothetical protein
MSRKRQQDEQERFKTWSKEQDDKFSKRFPEFNDPEKGPKVRASVTSYLTKEVGVPEDVLPKLWNNPLFRDEMFQRVIYEASRFHAAQQRAKSAVAAPKPAPSAPAWPRKRAHNSRTKSLRRPPVSTIPRASKPPAPLPISWRKRRRAARR